MIPNRRNIALCAIVGGGISYIPGTTGVAILASNPGIVPYFAREHLFDTVVVEAVLGRVVGAARD